MFILKTLQHWLLDYLNQWSVFYNDFKWVAYMLIIIIVHF